MLSYIWLFATLCIVACQAPLSMEFFKQGHWSGLPFPPLGDLPQPGVKLMSLESPALQADSLPAPLDYDHVNQSKPLLIMFYEGVYQILFPQVF